MTTTIGSLRVSDNQFAAAINNLGRFVAIPSVSNAGSPDYHPTNLTRAAEFVVNQLLDLNFNVQTRQINGSPLYVLAAKIIDAAKPTVLLYGHYDVQPVERDPWNSNPFEMVERNGRLYGRGASDDKAGIIVITTALKAMREAGQESNFNLKILFEGEEEVGSPHISTLLQQEAHNLTSDALIVLDGGNKDENTGTIENSTRGVLTMALRVDALVRPTHSGVGCLAPDPAQALARLISSLHPPRAIPGFMDDCIYASNAEIQLLDASSTSEADYRTEHGVITGANLRGNPANSIYHRILEEPSISVLNMTCGRPNGGNSIQESAECTIGIRLTAGQDPERIERVIRNHLHTQPTLFNLPFTLNRISSACQSWRTDATGAYATKYLNAMASSYPRTAVMPTGGTIPLFEDFTTALPQMEMFLVGVEDPDTAAHSHNESQSKAVFRRAIDSLIAFLRS